MCVVRNVKVSSSELPITLISNIFNFLFVNDYAKGMLLERFKNLKKRVVRNVRDWSYFLGPNPDLTIIVTWNLSFLLQITKIVYTFVYESRRKISFPHFKVY